jgi:hypothetical protein
MKAKIHPNTPNFFLDYKYKVVDKLGRDLKKGEIEVVMRCYINDYSVDFCVKDLRYTELL